MCVSVYAHTPKCSYFYKIPTGLILWLLVITPKYLNTYIFHLKQQKLDSSEEPEKPTSLLSNFTSGQYWNAQRFECLKETTTVHISLRVEYGLLNKTLSTYTYTHSDTHVPNPKLLSIFHIC